MSGGTRDACEVARGDPLQAAETSMRELLEREGLEQPDEVEYREASIALCWRERKLVVEIDVTDHPAFEGGARPGPA
jgi:hypothetical protein